MEPDKTLKRTQDLGLLAVVRGESRGAAVEVSEALVEGGVLGIEITFTTPEAPRVIRDLDEEYGDLILLGAGTVTTHEQVEQAAEAGATFLVSPGCDPNLLPAMLGTGLLVLPGTLTPSEVMLARGLGARAVKLFGRAVLPEGPERPFPRRPLRAHGRRLPGKHRRLVCGRRLSGGSRRRPGPVVTRKSRPRRGRREREAICGGSARGQGAIRVRRLLRDGNRGRLEHFQRRSLSVQRIAASDHVRAVVVGGGA